MPTEIHVSTCADGDGKFGILSIHKKEGVLDLALDPQTADRLAEALDEIRANVGP